MIFQEILESIADHVAMNAINHTINTLRATLNNFDEYVNSIGRAAALSNLQDILNDSYALDWYIDYLTRGTVNSKVVKTKSKFQQVRIQIEQKINSGL